MRREPLVWRCVLTAAVWTSQPRLRRPFVLDLLLRHKPAVVALLRSELNQSSTEDWQAYFDERAGIAEFDCGLSRQDAEARSLDCRLTELTEYSDAVQWTRRSNTAEVALRAGEHTLDRVKVGHVHARGVSAPRLAEIAFALSLLRSAIMVPAPAVAICLAMPPAPRSRSCAYRQVSSFFLPRLRLFFNA
jgi:hypothetical protein